MTVDIHADRIRDYGESHCWQYDIRVNNLNDDLASAGLTAEQAESMTVADFHFSVATTSDERAEATEFIKRHEWLGKLAQYTTHWFIARHTETGILAGVVTMGMPAAFSKALGDDTRKLERLINRGACISWSPKNLGSAMVMWSIRWMVENTDFRLFVAYSDPLAYELGTIYQACNFYYLGQKFGGTKRYINPYSGKIVTDRFFRSRSAYKRYAAELEIPWGADWVADNGMTILWENIPDDVERALRKMSVEKQGLSEPIIYPKKHKYAMLLGRDRRETASLRREFLARNKIYPYPKDRGV